MSFRLFLILPLCLILYGCGSSYSDELSLEDIGEESSASVNETETEEATAETGGIIYVYACGKVNAPGVYTVPQGSRIFEVLSLAGGVTDEADISAINQAEPCYDGEKIYVPALGEEDGGDAPDAGMQQDDRININTADSSELQTLKGIGASRAEDIISFREKNGKFDSVESIMEVPGIKQGTFDRIKDRIKV